VGISNYEVGMNLDYQALVHTTVDLEIDQAKWYGVVVDDVHKYQTDLDLMEDFTDDAAKQLDIATDLQVLGSITTQLTANTKGTAAGINDEFNFGTTSSAVSLDKTNILDYIVDMGTVLDQYNFSQDGRWLLLPPTFCGLISKSDLKDASLAGDNKSVLRTKVLGEINKFTIYTTNQLPYVSADSAYRVFAGHKSALTFAGQATNHETGRLSNTFGSYMRGLFLYGSKVIKTDGIVELYAKNG